MCKRNRNQKCQKLKLKNSNLKTYNSLFCQFRVDKINLSQFNTFLKSD